MNTYKFEFDLATEYISNEETIRQDVIVALEDKFATPEQVKHCAHHKLRVRVYVDDLGWSDK